MSEFRIFCTAFFVTAGVGSTASNHWLATPLTPFALSFMCAIGGCLAVIVFGRDTWKSE